ncbi:MAG TPA: hypothetical protein VHQ20_02455 [Patescibacteria group bacterium]|nr:hypothetical protein [Patescibacteria group bacterium]
MVFSVSLVPHSLFALTLTGSQYQLENPTFTAGGGNHSSAGTYSVQDASGGSNGANSTSSNYQLQTGSIKTQLPGVPGVPTFTNTGGTLYTNLDFVILTGANASDTQFAIAISTDNFTTTNYVQTNDTIGATVAWQDYAGWGSGTGERLVSLTANTTYKIKVKARLGAGNESGYSSVSTAATVNPSLSMTVAGVSSGASVGGTTTNITSTANTVPFGTLSTGSIKIGAQTITVSTNAVSGYTTTVFQDGALRKTNGTTIPALTATNASPAAWPLSITDARFGYHTTDSTLCTGTAGRFTVADTFAALTTSPLEVACSGAQVTNEATSIVYKVEVEGMQPPGNYQNVISYITSAQY